MRKTLVTASLLCSGSLGLAQDGALPRFAIEPSELTLAGDVRPRQYLGVVGARAAWLGWETGEAELWVHPLKLARDFRLDFKIPEYEVAVRGADLARTVEVRPELTTITYSHATFTVREHILAPADAPGLLVLLEVDSYRPFEIVVSFKSALQYAWPAGLGGQYVFWDQKEKAFVLSESLRKHNAFIGSPWAGSASSHPAHALPDAPSSFTIPVQPERAGREFIPIAIAAGIAPRAEVAESYRSLLGRAAALYRDKRDRALALLDRVTEVSTPDPRLNLALRWAALDLEDQRVCNPDLGCGLVAGWGASGESARPGFGWFFGGDAAINSLAMSSLGLTGEVAEGLRFLAKYQREDGKIPHEISQAAARIPWFTDFPYAYYHADTTPFWLLALGRYVQASGDRRTLEELWPAAKRAWAWGQGHDSDGDGIIENSSAGLGAIEVGDIGKDMHQDIYLAAVWIEAARAMERLAQSRGEQGLAAEAKKISELGRRSLNQRYWLEKAGHHAFGVLKSGATSDTLTVWPATAAAFGLLDAPRAQRTLGQLGGHRLTADWGARMLTTESPLYDPTHYNMGAVWPFVTGFLAWGHYRYERPWSGYPLVEALGQMTFDWARGRHPELLSGAYYRPLDEAVPQQFFATSMFATSVLSGLLGWEPDAMAGEARLAPQLPPQWERVTVRRLRMGATSLDVTLAQAPGHLSATFAARGPEVRVRFEPGLPPGARQVRSAVDGASADLGSGVRVGSKVVRVDVRWQGGLAVIPPTPRLRPGQSDEGLRILDYQWNGRSWVLEVEGVAGRSYEVELVGEPISRVSEGVAKMVAVGERTRLKLSLPPGGHRFARGRYSLDRSIAP